MDIARWKERLSSLPLGDLHIFQEVPSTNLEAARLLEEGVAPFSLVLADSQSAGRGRHGRTWITQPGEALAFSWILLPEPGRIQPETLGRLSGLGALAVAETLQEKHGLPARIKWPNDVLVKGKKVAGILVEVHWNGCQLLDVILGIGINVGRLSIPEDPDFNFPATTLEEECGNHISRLDLLIDVLGSLQKWHRQLAEPSFIKSWNHNLAYKSQPVRLVSPKGLLDHGKLLAVDEDGSLILDSTSGERRNYHSGEIQLRLVDRS